MHSKNHFSRDRNENKLVFVSRKVEGSPWTEFPIYVMWYKIIPIVKAVIAIVLHLIKGKNLLGYFKKNLCGLFPPPPSLHSHLFHLLLSSFRSHQFKSEWTLRWRSDEVEWPHKERRRITYWSNETPCFKDTYTNLRKIIFC